MLFRSRASPTRVANTMTVNPIAAALLASQLVGEAVTLNLVLGLVAVFAGIWLATSQPAPPGQTGELKVWRRDRWVPTKDLGRVDEDGCFWHGGRADDVIISAGWTMSAVEIEDAILKHPDVQEAAAIGIPDALRGQIVKAFVVSRRLGDPGFVDEKIGRAHV